jgi:hypothetical protein
MVDAPKALWLPPPKRAPRSGAPRVPRRVPAPLPLILSISQELLTFTQRVESALADTWRKRSAFTGRVGRVSVCTFLATRGCLQTTKGSSGCAGVDGVTSLNCDRRCPTQSGVSAPDATDEVADGVCFHFYLKPNEWGQQGATISGVAL